MRKICCVVIFLFCHDIGYAQDFTTGLLPSAVIGTGITKSLSWNMKLESMQRVYANEEGNEDYRYIRTDIQNFLNFKINPFLKVTGGYQYRFLNDQANRQRFIQQLSWVQMKRNFRFGHRIRTDQTISRVDKLLFRARYRLSFEKPLQGATIDPREFYLVSSGEMLTRIRGKDLSFEGRLGSSIGYNMSRGRKIEIGADFRADEFETDVTDNQLWWTIAYFTSF